jgi:uncharacterized protein (DUF2164 family)
MRKKLLFVIVLTLLAAVSLSACKPKPDGYVKTVEDFFGYLNDYDFASAAALLGDGTAYDSVIEAYTKTYDTELEKTETLSYIEFVYSNVSYEIIEESLHDANASITVEITAYNTDAIFVYEQNKINAYMSTSEYTSADEVERYVLLCDYIPKIYKDMKKALTPVTSTLVLTVEKTDDGYVIVPSLSLFDAIGGMN